MNLTIIIPFYNGYDTILKLLNSLPEIPIILVDDRSEKPLREYFDEKLLSSFDCKIITLTKKGYFSGAVNAGIRACNTDVLILNQDSYFEDDQFFNIIEEKKSEYALIGERISGNHPAWTKGYVHGTCMYMRRDSITATGFLDEVNFPLWGSTAEWQARVCRKGYKVLPLKDIPGFVHARTGNFGNSIKSVLKKEPEKKDILIRTPPLISVIVPCYNYGRYLKDCVASLVGGNTSAGSMGQSIQCFEIIIVDDCSTDETPEVGKSLADPWKGIHYYRTPVNGGTANALNFGISKSYGKFITFLSADDMREPKSLEMLLEPLKTDSHIFTYDDVTLFVHGKRNEKVWKMPDTYTIEGLINKNVIHSSIMYSYEAWKDVGGYPPQMNDGREDWAFNIALSLKGYCGVRVNYPGLLYRREGQNRSLTNTNPKDREKFLAKLKSIFPDAYAGRFPMGCCGGGRAAPGAGSRRTTRGGTYVSEQSLAGAAGMTLVEYVGTNWGNQTFFGPVTGQIYIFSAKKNRRNVDNRDLTTDRGTGLLQITHNRKPLFKRVAVAPKIPEPEPLPVPVPAPVPVAAKKVVGQKVPEPEKELVREEPKDIVFDLSSIPGMNEEVLEALVMAGFSSPQQIVDTAVEDLSERLGWSKARARGLKSSAKKAV